MAAIKNCHHLDEPSRVQLCILARDCLVSNWSDWSLWRRSAISGDARDQLVRTRKVTQLPRGKGRSCPSLREVKMSGLAEMRSICVGYRWLSGSWSSCHPQDGDTHGCGTGLQRRTNVCVDVRDSRPVSSSMCERPIPSQVRSCPIPCPQNCIVSEWTNWGQCLPHICKVGKGKAKPGYRVRTREVLREGLHGGAPCPYLKEIQPCHYPACYAWRSDRMGECQLTYPDMQCGAGSVNKSSVCYSISGETVVSHECVEPRPDSKETCSVPCDNDCVLSEWSEWSDCSRNCGVKRLSGFRERRRHILAEHRGTVGLSCPAERLLVERERCNDLPCVTYRWMSMRWGECRPIGARSCGYGEQRREALCLDDAGNRVNGKRCIEAERPTTARNCTIPCATSCRVSDYTDWSPCPITCYTDDNISDAIQHRYRFILDSPDEGGAPCPEVMESRACPNIAPCTTYQWEMGRWSHCIFPKHYEKCGAGYRAREVRCMQEDHVVPDEFCIHQLGSMVEVTQPCHLSCGTQVCKFSEWSPYGPCDRLCGGVRNRTRTMEGSTYRIAECYDKTKYPLLQNDTCACKQYTPGPLEQWSHCMLDRPAPGSDVMLQDKTIYQRAYDVYAVSPAGREQHCGIGHRIQLTVCGDEHGRNVSAKICGRKPFMEEMCFIPCAMDCRMSQWTQWTPCTVTDTVSGRDGVTVLSSTVTPCGNGVQIRSRYVLNRELDGGRQCPELVDGEQYERKSCHISCGKHTWRVGEWSPCSLLPALAADNQYCGVGLQSRTVRCVQRLSKTSDDVLEAEEQQCDMMMKPADTNHCTIPCPGHCVVNTWSEWSNCPASCYSGSMRERVRTIARKPSQGVSVACPALTESEMCEEEGNCFRYEWEWSDWSDCILDGDNGCGVGQMERHAQCVRSGRYKVDQRYCQQHVSRSPEGISQRSCDVPCPVDCVVSQWSEWSACSASCGLAFQTRERHELVASANRGRQCPDPLIQSRPCVYTECLHWQLSDWSACYVPSGGCGYGMQNRTWQCQLDDGSVIDDFHCMDLPKKHETLTEQCLLPCPGDCEMSSWSAWSPCNRPCSPSPDEVGVQVRSRAVLSYPTSRVGEPCSSSLYETRPCTDGACMRYSWHAASWTSDSDRRDIWCENSHGARVTGGCNPQYRPSTLRSCDPPCNVINTYCHDINVCACVTGYRAMTSQQGVLLSCVPFSEDEEGSGVVNGTEQRDMTAENLALYFPNGSSNIWFYGILAAAGALLVFIIVAVYTVCKGMREQHKRNGTTTSFISLTRLRKKQTKENNQQQYSAAQPCKDQPQQQANGTQQQPAADMQQQLHQQLQNTLQRQRMQQQQQQQQLGQTHHMLQHQNHNAAATYLQNGKHMQSDHQQNLQHQNHHHQQLHQQQQHQHHSPATADNSHVMYSQTQLPRQPSEDERDALLTSPQTVLPHRTSSHDLELHYDNGYSSTDTCTKLPPR